MAESIHTKDYHFGTGRDKIRYTISTQEVSWDSDLPQPADLQQDENSSPVPFKSPPITSLSLIITGMCNLRCWYCYARGLHDTNEKAVMSVETGRQAIDLFLCTSSTPDCQVLFIGGEPMLHWDCIRTLVEYGEKQASLLQKHIVWKLSTNGTIFSTGSFEFLKGHRFELLIDIDGPPEIHDRNRPYTDGSGSYAIISSNYQRLRESGISPVILRATVTPFFPHVAELYAALLARKPDEVWIIPQHFDFGSPGWREDTLEPLLQGYSDLASAMLTRIIDGTYRGTRLDPFTPFIYLLCSREKKGLFCGGAGSVIAVTTDGRLYPCCALIHDNLCIGNIREGIDHSLLAGWSESCSLERRPSCSICWARYLCGGGCYSHAIGMNGSLDRPVETECRILKHLIELSMWLYLRLLDEKPGFFLNLVSWKPGNAVIPIKNSLQ
jgi:uncharacterized protein